MNFDYWMQWYELVMLVVALEFLVLILWGIGRLISKVLDRRPRDSVRCRKCWYDLRSISRPECPECGANLDKLGVWPPGKPVRRHWVNIMGFWLAACVALGAISSELFYKHSRIVAFAAVFSLPGDSNSAWEGVALAGYKIGFLGTTPSDYPVRSIRFQIQTGSGMAVYEMDPRTLQLFEFPSYPFRTSFLTPRTVMSGNYLRQQYATRSRSKSLTQEQIDNKVDNIMAILASVRQIDTINENVRFQWYAETSANDPARSLVTSITASAYSWYRAPWWVRFIPLVPVVLIWLAGNVGLSKWLKKHSVAKWPIEPTDTDHFIGSSADASAAPGSLEADSSVGVAPPSASG